ncbi:hypothetical protein CHS0354_009133 [Potamilus streckersoni]|uniref:Uncharacterized protein n=1 Tax=Potamilus streckersoni TaxID=2493646 RepID=A0AAE0SSD6_9BIVA|nr:hypothetical protein CHS0354_009133 [Potamilus streckersoni]
MQVVACVNTVIQRNVYARGEGPGWHMATPSDNKADMSGMYRQYQEEITIKVLLFRLKQSDISKFEFLNQDASSIHRGCGFRGIKRTSGKHCDDLKESAMQTIADYILAAKRPM